MGWTNDGDLPVLHALLLLLLLLLCVILDSLDGSQSTSSLPVNTLGLLTLTLLLVALLLEEPRSTMPMAAPPSLLSFTTLHAKAIMSSVREMTLLHTFAGFPHGDGCP